MDPGNVSYFIRQFFLYKAVKDLHLGASFSVARNDSARVNRKNGHFFSQAKVSI